ncbi:MAG: hypothetical protein M1828_002091 [Chrysothrix sp. TS-e1954]|nr:MAG: hypothetical protein M1828_002091 [Chrysothrix sp. TS-e1954]
MGVPKFFRWMSERYPAISQLIAENRIPEFDNLYLDMNGIIHNCTHSDSDSPTFRMTEDKMFIAIFNYIEHLFGKIKPKQIFFMAIDGVAPRAKMNQQRARRFRTALDVEQAREKALREGAEMPKEEAFDSNCITPGTEFMARLTRQLKYFISKKIAEDADWQNVKVVLSGHEVPGEGEHKIMEYIRQAKSQPGYDPNVRHCLYGLDADLIMLGLLSHDPHFCLLREEVTFGRQDQKKRKELEHQNFYLMHLCVVREYLELEFQQLKEPGALDFAFDLERVIDDFILMAFFVGNDFLPNLPHLHINEGALALMFETYKSVLPKAGGYLNESGTINLDRLSLLLDELSNVEYRFFEADNSDASWLRSKQKQHNDDEAAKPTKRGQIVMSTPQRDLFRGIKKWVNSSDSSRAGQMYDLPVSLPARDREFVKSLADSLHIQWKTVEDATGKRHMQLSHHPPPEADEGDEEEDEEAQTALFRVVKRYENAKIVDVSADQAQDEMERKYQAKFFEWRNSYYTEKLVWGLDNHEELRKLTENYVQGLQWVLYYYYRGVASWPWFFRYHYSPMMSDVKKGLGANLNFELGQPFRPYQQLMGVLPDRSKRIVPEAYHDLMTNKDSPIIDFYPRDFDLDMNGKKMEWEAVVKIPFIDESRLLPAMRTRDHLLTDDERARNEFGVSLQFTSSRDVSYTYPSSLPGIFNDIPNCNCVENIYELPTMEGLDYHVGLVDGVKLGKASLAGFPSLKVLPFAGALAFHGVSVFQQETRNQSMILTVLGAEAETKVEKAKLKLGKVVHVGYPFLQEAKITRVSDEMFHYTIKPGSNVPDQRPQNNMEISDWHKKAERIEGVYSKRLGTIIGSVETLVHVELLKGLRKTDKGDMVKEYGDIPGMETEYAAQTIVDEVVSQDERFLEKEALPIEEEFPVGARAFFLGGMAYGRPLEVYAHAGQDKVDIWVGTSKIHDETWGRAVALNALRTTPYTPSFAVARLLNLSPLALSKITASFSVESSSLRLNLGLNLKFEAKKQKVLGYSRKGDTGWEFSQKAIDLIMQYMVQFPEFIAGIQRNPKGDHFSDTDFYPKSEAAAKMKEIGSWLKSIESKSFERVPLDANQLDSDAVKQIEDTAANVLAQTPPPEAKRIRAAPRHALLKPSDAEQRLGQQKFVLGDRIVYVQDSGKVPLGLTGTVIGLTRTPRAMLLDIVLDSTFMSGTTLGDRCSAFRGATVPQSSVLNLTDRQIFVDTRAASQRTGPQQQNTPMLVNGGYGAPMGPGNTGQLFNAQAPPPLAGSYRGAVSGQRASTNGHYRGGRGSRGNGLGYDNATHASAQQYQQQYQPPPQPPQTLPFRNSPQPNRSRANGAPSRGAGRGNPNGANRQGFTVVDMQDPTSGVVKNNPNFRPQNHSAAPPPPALDSQRGSRGRGRGGRFNAGGAPGRTRGAGARGRGAPQVDAVGQ